MIYTSQHGCVKKNLEGLLEHPKNNRDIKFTLLDRMNSSTNPIDNPVLNLKVGSRGLKSRVSRPWCYDRDFSGFTDFLSSVKTR